MMKKIVSLILALMLLTLPCALADEDAATLSVTGTGTVSLPTDTAMVMLGVRETASEVQDAQASVNKKIASIRAALNGMGIDNSDITTESLYIYADYNYDSSMREVLSYTATNTLTVTVRQIDNTSAVIDTAFASGANTLDNVSFYATDISAASDQAYAQAIADAKHKAQVVAEAAGVRCLSIKAINEGAATTWVDDATKLRASNLVMTEDAAFGTDIQQGNATVTVNVTITYTIAP